MKTHTKIIISSIGALAMVGTSSAATIFDATTSNTTIVSNTGQGGPGVVTGAPGALVYTSPANSFNNSGIVSTDDINTLLGSTALLATDTITLQLTIDSITGSEFRANGLTVGLSSDATPAGAVTADALSILLNHDNAGGINPSLQGLASGDTLAPATTFSDDLLRDGFDLTIIANSAGYTLDIDGILLGSGTLTQAEFLGLGSSHLYYSSQQFTNDAMVTTFSEASIDVTSSPIPEPSSTALLGLGGLALIMRRRK